MTTGLGAGVGRALVESRPLRARNAETSRSAEPTTPASVAEPLACSVKALEVSVVDELSGDALSAAGSVPAEPLPAPPPQAASTTVAIRERLMDSGRGSEKPGFCVMFNPQGEANLQAPIHWDGNVAGRDAIEPTGPV